MMENTITRSFPNSWTGIIVVVVVIIILIGIIIIMGRVVRGILLLHHCLHLQHQIGGWDVDDFWMLLLPPPLSSSSLLLRRSCGDSGGVGRDVGDGYSILLDTMHIVGFGAWEMDDIVGSG